MLDSAMADVKKKTKYLTKSVKFGEKQFTLFSLDGVTWSSRREELHMILERQEQERKAFNQIVGEQTAEKAAPEGEEQADAVDEKLIEAEDEELLPIDAEDDSPKAKLKASGKKALEKSKPATAISKGKQSKGGMKVQSGAEVLPAPKARASSKPAKKAAKAKSKKKVA